MLNDKELFSKMIKYHPAIVGWLIKTKKVQKQENELVIFKEKENKEKQYYIPKGDKIYEDGVRWIYLDTYHYDYIKISLVDYGSFKPITSAGIAIFEISIGRYCHISQFEELVIKFPDLLFDAFIPDNYPRFTGLARDNYFKILEHQIDYLKNHNYKFPNGCCFRYNILGDSNSVCDYLPEKKANVEKHGLFANLSIYKRIVWDFDLVEKYKDQIIWRELIEKSNLLWDEEMLNKYDKYIPWCSADESTYCDKFKHKIAYEKFGFLSNEFLDSHKDKLDWKKVFDLCKFNWNGEEMKYFCQYALSIDMPYSKTYKKTSAASQIECYLSRLIDKKDFQWTSDNLQAWLSVREFNWNVLVDGFRPKLFNLFLAIPNIKEIAEPHIKDIDHFWDIVSNENSFPYDELSEEFTIENIEFNLKNWSRTIEKKYSHTGRIGKCYYSYYNIITKWDILGSHRNIPLSYEMAKYLKGKDITLGGMYVESDGYYLEEGRSNINPVYNALYCFSGHHISSEKDKEKIVMDSELLDFFLGKGGFVNLDILEYLAIPFFKDYSVADYISIINQMKDWDSIIEISDMKWYSLVY